MTDAPTAADGPPVADSPGAAIGAAPNVSPVRPGELVPAWRIALVAGWAMVVFAYSAVWKASVELGIGTWWLGARSSPQPVFVRLVPFALAIGLGLLSSYGIRRVPLVSMLAALVLVAIAVPDFSRSIGLAVIELVIGAAMLLVALASLTGVVKTDDR